MKLNGLPGALYILGRMIVGSGWSVVAGCIFGLGLEKMVGAGKVIIEYRMANHLSGTIIHHRSTKNE
jgi:hypothetical protein